MGIKRKREKRAYAEYLTKYAVKIKCCYCDLSGECRWRAGKEDLEKQGVTTRCTATPNRRVKPSNGCLETPSFKQYSRNRERYNPPKEVDGNDGLQGHQRAASNPPGNHKRIPSDRKGQRS